MMILSSDELDILHYLRGWNGKFITLMEISRRAGGRRRYEESPNWPNGLMTRLVEAALIEVNERGHYRLLENEDYFPPGTAIAPVTEATEAIIVDEDYFPPARDPDSESRRWVSPEIAKILKKSGKKFGGGKAGT